MTDTSAQTAVDTAPAPDAPAPEVKKVPTRREAVEAAAREVEAREAAGTTETEKALRVLKGEPEDKPEPKPKAEPKPEAKAKPDAKPEPKPDTKAPERGEDGKFRSGKADDDKAEAKPATNDPDEDDERSPPKRFSKDAQAEWEKAPESVKGETRRAIRELETGLQEHQEKSKRWADVEPYERLANDYGLNGVKGVLADYEGMARMMATDPLKVFDTLATRHGISLQKVAAHVLQQDLDEYAEQTGSQIAQLTQQNQQLMAEVNQFRAEKMRGVETAVEKFKRESPRFEELAPTIKWILKTNDGIDRSDPTKALKEAYDMADRLKPGPTPAPQPQTPAASTRPDLSAQTALAAKSVSGAPGPGSNPANRKPAVSTKEAVRNAAQRTGLI